jgi:hypothetical protein
VFLIQCLQFVGEIPIVIQHPHPNPKTLTLTLDPKLGGEGKVLIEEEE